MKKTILLLLFAVITLGAYSQDKPRIIIETDIGGDPDDQATFVRFLLYANEFDIEGIMINSVKIQNSKDYGFGFGLPIDMAKGYINAYGKIVDNLNRHAPSNRQFPSAESLLAVTKRSRRDEVIEIKEGSDRIIEVLKKNDDRPIWYTDWGTSWDGISALRLALDRIKEGNQGISYAAAVQKIKFIEYENLRNSTSIIKDHLGKIPFIMDTFLPDQGSGRWAARWSKLTGEDCKESHDINNGCRRQDWEYLNNLHNIYNDDINHNNDKLRLARYYTIQKEGDTATWMHLLENGINVVGSPELGSWSGRYTQAPGQKFWKCQETDVLRNANKRDNTLIRWGDRIIKEGDTIDQATDIINDFKVRWEWALPGNTNANHHPIPVINGNSGLAPIRQSVVPGQKIKLDATGSSDPDGNTLRYQWVIYNEISLPGASLTASTGVSTEITIPDNDTGELGYVHAYVRITDNGTIPLTRYKRVIFEVPAKPSPKITLVDASNIELLNEQFLPKSRIDYTISANVVWDDQMIDRVDFFNNGVKVATDNEKPYSFGVSRVVDATHRVFARLHYKCEGVSEIRDSETATIIVADRLIKDVTTPSDKDYKNLRDFGKVKPYTDYNTTITEFPSHLERADYVATPNRDRGSSNGKLFTVNLLLSSEVYIAFDGRAPITFSDREYIDTGEHIRTDDGAILRLYKKKFNAGPVVIGGANVGSTGANNLFVIVKSLPVQVAITSPANGSQFSIGSNVPIQVNAFGSFPIEQVEYFVTYDGNVTKGNDLSAPYSYPLNNIQGGVYSIQVRMWYKNKGVSTFIDSPVSKIYGTRSLIKSISTPSDKVYRKMQSFGNNSTLFTDTNFKVTQHPSFLTGAEYIMTPNRDAGSSNGGLLTANLVAAADVYVAFDRKIPVVPSWIRGYYQDTREHVRTNGGAIMRVYKKRVGAGNVVFGGASARTAGATNYIVIVKAVAPSIVITSIANGQNFQVGNNILIATNPSAFLPITKVTFFDNNKVIGEDTTAPFSFTLRGLTTGSHKIQARMQYGFPGQLQYAYSGIITIHGTNVLINSISTPSNKPYRKMKGFGNSVTLFTDLNSKVTQHPSFLTGAEYIMTPNRDAGSSNGRLLTANLAAAADVYVAFDRKIPVVPSWIRGYYQDTREHVRTNWGAIMRVYKKRVGPGNVVFGGARARTAGATNYIVIVKRATSAKSLKQDVDLVMEQPDQLKLYPTPTTGVMFIDTNNQEQTWTVFSMSGKVITSGKGNSIDISNVADGYYIVKIGNQTFNIVKKS